MQSAVINFTTEEEIKQEAQKTARKMGISLSTILNHYLKHFVRTKTVVFSAEDEEPNKYLIHALKESKADVKTGKVISFEKSDNALSYVDSLIESDKSTQ